MTEKRTRVAVVVTKLVAGAGGVALRGALALDPERYSVTLMAGEGDRMFERAAAGGCDVVRLRHMRPDLAPGEDVKGVRELVELLTRGGFDVVHTHSAKAGAIGRIAAHRTGAAAIVHTFHGFPFHDFQSRLRRSTYITIERRLGRLTDQFLAIGSSVAAQAVRLELAPPDRIRVCDSSVDDHVLPVTPERRAAARRSLGVPEGMKVVGTVGRLDNQKAPHDLVEAIAHLGRDDVFTVWIGGGPLFDKTSRLISKLGLQNRFFLLGQRDDVPALLPGFDAFAMSSLYEGIPCALIEAMRCGIPAAANAVNGVPDVIVAGQTGLLTAAGRPATLARAIAYLLDNPERAGAMAAAARVNIKQRFDTDSLERDVAGAYEEALGAAAEPPVELKLASGA